MVKKFNDNFLIEKEKIQSYLVKDDERYCDRM